MKHIISFLDDNENFLEALKNLIAEMETEDNIKLFHTNQMDEFEKFILKNENINQSVLIDYTLSNGLKINDLVEQEYLLNKNIVIYIYTGRVDNIEISVLQKINQNISSLILKKPLQMDTILDLIEKNTESNDSEFRELVSKAYFSKNTDIPSRVIDKEGEIVASFGRQIITNDKIHRVSQFNDLSTNSIVTKQAYIPGMKNKYSKIVSSKISDDYYYQIFFPTNEKDFFLKYDKDFIEALIQNIIDTLFVAGFTRIRVYGIKNCINSILEKNKLSIDSSDGILHGYKSFGMNEYETEEFSKSYQILNKFTRESILSYEKRILEDNQDLICDIHDVGKENDTYWNQIFSMVGVDEWIEFPLFNKNKKVIGLLVCDKYDIEKEGANDVNNTKINKSELVLHKDFLKKSLTYMGDQIVYLKDRFYLDVLDKFDNIFNETGTNTNNDSSVLNDENKVLNLFIKALKISFGEKILDVNILKFDQIENNIKIVASSQRELKHGDIQEYPLLKLLMKNLNSIDKVVIQDFNEKSEWFKYLDEKSSSKMLMFWRVNSFKSFVILPIYKGGKNYGFIIVFSSEKYFYSRTRLKLLDNMLDKITWFITLLSIQSEQLSFSENIAHEMKKSAMLIKQSIEDCPHIIDNRISENLEIMLDNLKNFFDYSSIPKISLENIDLGKLLNKLCEGDSNVTLEVKRDLMINSDVEIIKTIIENLKTNALKYSSDKKMKFILKREDEHIFIIARNKGSVPNGIVHKIFNKGIHGDIHSDSTGIGLAIVKGRVEKLGWTIALTSTINPVEFKIKIKIEEN